jgi:hypothetical protein
MKIPNPEIIRISAISYLREIGANEAADLLRDCKLEIGDAVQRYMRSNKIGLNITLRCKAKDLAKFFDQDSAWEMPSETHTSIKLALESILPTQLDVHDLSARSLLIDRLEFDKTELERLIEAQIDLMIAVATGGHRIQLKNNEFRERREKIIEKLEELGKTDPNPFEDLWAWYGRWSSGDLPSYQSRRDFVRNLYRPLLEDIAGAPSINPSEPSREPTGWDKVDRIVDQIVKNLAEANREEDFQTVGLLCRECLISLAQAVYKANLHKTTNGISPSNSDAYRMLEAYFYAEYSGPKNEALRRHAKASLNLANELQHKRTAVYRDATLCSEATRTVVNIVAITSGRR